MDLKGRVALVTGSGSGIGASIAKTLAAEGASVVVNYFQSEERAQRTLDDISAAGGQAIAVRANVTDWEDVKNMVAKAGDRFGAIDILVNNALAKYSFDPVKRKSFMDIPWEDYQQQFDGTVRGAFNCCKAVLPHMLEQGSGKIINIVTDLIDRPSVPYHDYTTAKAAMIGFSRNLVTELGPSGITVNMIAPGLVPGTDASKATTEEIVQLICASTPLRRCAVPEDVAGAVAALASDWSNFLTGQYLTVDGGLVMP
jgi:3-oxoacyl-[acyl-carrier protein] reductase